VHSLEMHIGADSSDVVTQWSSTQCQGLMLCQVSSHSDQWFLFYHAIIPTHTHIRTSWQGDCSVIDTILHRRCR